MFPSDKAATNVKAVIPSEKYSQGPKLKASLDINGLINVAIIMLKKVPIKEAIIHIIKAFSGFPFLHMGWPSKHVAIDDGEPGIPSSTAAMKLPEIPPTQTPSNKAIPNSGDIVNVSGSSNVTPVIAVNPGIAPKITPTIMPIRIRNIETGLNTV